MGVSILMMFDDQEKVLMTYPCILFGRLEQLLEVLVALLVLVTGFTPFGHGLTVEDEDVEEGVEEEHSLGLNAG